MYQLGAVLGAVLPGVHPELPGAVGELVAVQVRALPAHDVEVVAGDVFVIVVPGDQDTEAYRRRRYR